MQMQGLGMGNEKDSQRNGEKERERGKKKEREKTIIAVMNEGGGKSPQAITQSQRQASVALTSLS